MYEEQQGRYAVERLAFRVLLATDEEFRAIWDSAVSKAADVATAEVVHQRGDGNERGMKYMGFTVPIPSGHDREVVGVVFGEYAFAEAQRRLEAMEEKGHL